MRLPFPCVVVLATLLSTNALAEPDKSKRGFKIGDKSRIHLHIDVGVGYDTNPARAGAVNFTGAAGPAVDAKGDVKLAVRPGFEVDVPGRDFSLGLGGQFSLEQYFGVEDGVESQTKPGFDGHVALRAGATDSTLGFELKNHALYTPTFLGSAGLSDAFGGIGHVGLSESRNAFLANRGTANVIIRPGGGALDFRLGYVNAITIYDGLPNDQYHGIALEAKLRFLPKTAALFAANLGFYDVSDDEAARVQTEADRQKATPYSVELGLQGQLTEALSVIARIGFADSLNWKGGEDFFGELDEAINQRSVIANLRLSWAFDEKKNIWLGYQRALRQVIEIRSYFSNSIQLGTNIGVGDNFDFKLFFELDPARQYARDGMSSRTVRVDARVVYWFFEYLNAGIVYNMAGQFDSENPPLTVGDSVTINDYMKHLAMLVIGFRY